MVAERGAGNLGEKEGGGEQAKNKKRDSNTAQKIGLALVPFLARPNLKILYLVLSLL